jgi:SAM-dependent methyltransferase
VVLVVLDLGCGAGNDLKSWGIAALDKVIGIDIDKISLAIAKTRFCDRTYIQAPAECLPFKNESFDRVIAAVSLPYMNIQQALGEVHRILVPTGRLSLSLHPPSFTAAELLHNAIPKAIPTMFRLYVICAFSEFMFRGLQSCNGSPLDFVSPRAVLISDVRARTRPARARITIRCACAGALRCFSGASSWGSILANRASLLIQSVRHQTVESRTVSDSVAPVRFDSCRISFAL